jgi:hypothetical protein
VSKKPLYSSSQPRTPEDHLIIEQFRVQREITDKNNLSDEADEETRRRVSYTKEQKLGAISYCGTY